MLQSLIYRGKNACHDGQQAFNEETGRKSVLGEILTPTLPLKSLRINGPGPGQS